MASKLSLGESRFTGGYKLEFRQKKAQVIAKLYDKEDVKLGSYTLADLPIQPWTYETLPELAKSKIEQFLNTHHVPLALKRVTPLYPEEMVTTVKNLTLVSTLSSSSSSSTSSTAIFPFLSSTPSVTLSSSSYQPSLEDLKHLLHRFGYPESNIPALTQSSSSDEQKLLLVDTLFEHILSLSQIPSLDSSLLDIRDSQGYNLFLATVALGEENKYQAIFPYYRGKKELYAKDPQGRNALHIAASLGHHRLIPPLVEAGLKIDKKDGHGLVPLHWAIHAGNPDAVLALIEQGAPLATPWITPKGSHSPLEMTIAVGNPAILKVLLEKDRFKQLNLHQSVPETGTLLHLAIRANQAPMLEYLLSAHFDKVSPLLHHSDPEGRTPLQLAAYLGDLYAIRLLHRCGVELNYGEGEKGGTAVHYAAQGEQPDAIRLLDWLDADLLSTNDRGETPYILLKGKKTPAAQECKALLTRLPRMTRSEKTEPPNYTRRPPYNLVIQGGGPKGIAYLGALEAMERLGTLNELKRLAGTSAGAITAAFLAVGCQVKDLKILLNRNFEEFLDADNPLKAGLLGAAQRQSYQEAIRTLLKDYWGGWSTLLHPIKRAQNLKDKLINLTGLASGETIREWIEGVIQQQTGKKHCTFGELQELIHREPHKYKELHIFSVRVGTGPQPEIIRFSHEDPAWKDLIISDAVRASFSIPGVFQPHVLHFKDATGIRHPRENHGKFLDAGLIRNLPIDAFDAEKYQEDPHFRGEKTNRRTLGLSLREITPHREEEILNISSSTDLLKALMSTYYNAEQILLEETRLYKDRTIVIPIKGMSLLDFDVEEEIKKANIEAGRIAASEAFSARVDFSVKREEQKITCLTGASLLIQRKDTKLAEFDTHIKLIEKISSNDYKFSTEDYLKHIKLSWEISEDLAKEKHFREAEGILIATKNAIPIIPEQTYTVHQELARNLFDLYSRLVRFDLADKIIEETMEVLGDISFHPLFKVDLNKKAIYLKKDLLRDKRNKKYLIEALKPFADNVFLKIDPFEIGTQLICYKSNGKNPEIIIYDEDASDSEEENKADLIDKIQSTCEKIKIYSA